MNLPTTESDQEKEQKEQEKSEYEPEGRERRRRKRDYIRLNTIGTSESEEISKAIKEKENAPNPKTPKMKLDEAHRKIDTVAMMEQENKEGLETN